MKVYYIFTSSDWKTWRAQMGR